MNEFSKKPLESELELGESQLKVFIVTQVDSFILFIHTHTYTHGSKK